MYNFKEYINRQESKLNYFGDQIDYLYPMKLEEEEEDDYDEIEALKKKQKQVKEDLLNKMKTHDADKDKKDTSQ